MNRKILILVLLILFFGCVKEEVRVPAPIPEVTLEKFSVFGTLTQLEDILPHQRLRFKIYNKTYEVVSDENGSFAINLEYKGPSEILVSYVNSIGDTRTFRKYFSVREDHKLLINIDKNGSLKATSVK